MVGNNDFEYSGMRMSFLAALVAMILFAFFFPRILASQTITEDNCILGADVGSYNRGLATQAYMALKPRKHILAVMSVAAFAWPLIKSGLEPSVAGSIALALLQACGGVALFLFLCRNVFSVITSFLVTLLVYSLFGTVTMLSVTETYGTTLSAAAVTLLVAGEASLMYSKAPFLAASLVGMVGGLAGWANLPAIVFVLAFTGLTASTLYFSGWRRYWYSFIVPVGLAASIAAIPGFVIDFTTGFTWETKYVAAYASLSNFSDPRVLKDYLVSYFLFPIVSPKDYVQCRFNISDFSLSTGYPFRIVAACGVMALLMMGLAKAVWHVERRPFVLSMVAIVSFFFLFYIYFNPDEALLYSPQWTLPLIIGGVVGLEMFLNHERSLRFGIVAIFTLCLVLNVPPLTDLRTGDPTFCCPHPPATGLKAVQAFPVPSPNGRC